MRQDYRSKLPPAMILVAVLLVSVGLTINNIPSVASQEATLRSSPIKGNLPVSNPVSKDWGNAREISVPLSGQTVINPQLLEPSIRSLNVRSLQNGSWIAFLVTWSDTTNNSRLVATTDFRDSVAVQFAVTQGAPPYVCMGQTGVVVNVWHWKADWQSDINFAYQGLETAYPNFWTDHYPFAVGNPPYSLPSAYDTAEARTFLAGWAAGNLISNPYRFSPIEDLVAGGPGTLTTQPSQDVLGRGVWVSGVFDPGSWRVVFARPMRTSDVLDAQFDVSETKSVAFAVWDGANKEVDGRKAVSTWVVLSVDAAPPGLVGGHPVVGSSYILILVAILLVSLVIAASVRSRQRANKV